MTENFEFGLARRSSPGGREARNAPLGSAGDKPDDGARYSAAVTGREDGQEEAYLLGLRLQSRRVLVVGGGTVAARRVPRLLAAGAAVGVVEPAAHPALQK